MKDLSLKHVLLYIIIILLVSACNFSSQTPKPEIEVVEPTATVEIQPTATQPIIKNYSSEEYSFTYPNDYTITLPKPGFPVLTIYKADNKRMEIFQMKDFGDRPFGFSGTETQKEIDGYLPKVRIKLGNGDDQYDIWLFFSEGDTETKAELFSIVESILINQ